MEKDGLLKKAEEVFIDDGDGGLIFTLGSKTIRAKDRTEWFCGLAMRMMRGEYHCLPIRELKKVVDYELGINQSKEHKTLKKAYDKHMKNDSCENCQSYHWAIMHEKNT